MFWELVGVCQMGIEWWHWIGNLILTDHQIRQSFPNPTPSNEYQSIALHISNVFPQRKSFMWNLMWAFSHWVYSMHHMDSVQLFATFLFQTVYIQCSSSCSVYYILAPVYMHCCSVYYTHTGVAIPMAVHLSVIGFPWLGWCKSTNLPAEWPDPPHNLYFQGSVKAASIYRASVPVKWQPCDD